jgi:hypothetical protein
MFPEELGDHGLLECLVMHAHLPDPFAVQIMLSSNRAA